MEVDFEVDGEATIVPETNPMTEVIYSLLDRGADALEEILGRGKGASYCRYGKTGQRDTEILDRLLREFKHQQSHYFRMSFFQLPQ